MEILEIVCLCTVHNISISAAIVQVGQQLPEHAEAPTVMVEVAVVGLNPSIVTIVLMGRTSAVYVELLGLVQAVTSVSRVTNLLG